MKFPSVLGLFVLVATASAQDEAPPMPSADAQQPVQTVDKTGGFGALSPYEGRYDPKTVITFSGRISGISVEPPRPGMEAGFTLLIRTPNGGTATVDLGPSWYIDHQSIRYEIHDFLNVTGSKVMEDGHGLILASRVIGGGYDLRLRDAKGLPVWDAFRAQPLADVSAKNTVRGVVSSYDPETGSTILTTGTGNVQISTGPLWFQERQSYTVSIGDNLTFYAGPVLQVGAGVFVPTDTARLGDGYIIIGGGGPPVWKSWVPAPAH